MQEATKGGEHTEKRTDDTALPPGSQLVLPGGCLQSLYNDRFGKSPQFNGGIIARKSGDTMRPLIFMETTEECSPLKLFDLKSVFAFHKNHKRRLGRYHVTVPS